LENTGETLDLTGSWSWTETIGNNSCEDPQTTETYYINMIQDGSSVDICEEGWGCLPGELNGNSVSWEGSVPEDGGITSGQFNGTVSANGNSITGSGTYGWTDGDYSCSGVLTFSATRN
jgi:hypothetical protein